MGLIKLNPDKIAWDKKYCLYRFNSQGKFEEKVLETMIKDNKPYYYGFEDNERNRITFCGYEYLSVICYANSKLLKKSDSLLSNPFPFSRFPIIMEINVENYLDNLYKSIKGEGICESIEGEGIVIKDAVNINDITILYSSRIDLLNQRNPHPELDKAIEKHKIDIEISRKIVNPIKEDLFTNLDKDPEHAFYRLCSSGFGYGVGYNSEQKELVMRFLGIMKEKLGVIN